MLNKKEKIVMQYLFEVCSNNDGKCLLSARDISTKVFSKIELTDFEVDEIVNNLKLDDYIDVIHSDKKGQEVYLISLKEKGQGYQRERQNVKKSWRSALIRTIILAIVSFVVGIILKAIFS
ncbi:MAG: hypothetical protein IJA61_01530 [Clostridia bacterium]|nr:hypothetical protein [Clostridia bacterium]